MENMDVDLEENMGLNNTEIIDYSETIKEEEKKNENADEVEASENK